MLRFRPLQKPSGSSPEMNLTPMMDVVFLILIFFLLTSIVSTQPVLNLDLPHASHSKDENKVQIQLVIRKEGQIEIDGEEVKLTELETVLRQKMIQTEENKLLVAADKEAPFGRFVSVLDLVKKLNFSQLDILTQTAAVK